MDASTVETVPHPYRYTVSAPGLDLRAIYWSWAEASAALELLGRLYDHGHGPVRAAAHRTLDVNGVELSGHQITDLYTLTAEMVGAPREPTPGLWAEIGVTPPAL